MINFYQYFAQIETGASFLMNTTDKGAIETLRDFATVEAFAVHFGNSNSKL